MSRMLLLGCGAALGLVSAEPAVAEDLYKPSNWSALSTDRRASGPGDVLTILIHQSAESSNLAHNSSRRNTEIGARVKGGSVSEGGDLQLGGAYSGRGEVRRSERLFARMTVMVDAVLPNGDLVVLGEQWMRVNGENTRIAVRGQVRPEDIGRDNSVASSRIANAQIDYDGRGFVSRSARPGLVNRIFSFLGLG